MPSTMSSTATRQPTSSTAARAWTGWEGGPRAAGAAEQGGSGSGAAKLRGGGAGMGRMGGGAGNDRFYMDNLKDAVTELAGEGNDAVYSLVSHVLRPNVEVLVLTGTAASNGTGNALANTIYGNAAANILDGGAGADRLEGGRGDDRPALANPAGP